MGWKPFWASLSLPSMHPAFADMRTIQGALTTISQGLDPTITNPGDPWGRLMNYPKIWTSLASWLDFRQEKHFIAYNLLVLAAFYSICGYLLWRYPSAELFLMVFSPASLLAVERGNNDLLIFVLVTLFSRFKGFKSLLPWALAMTLKIYPAVLLPLALLTKGRSSAGVFLLVAAGIIFVNLGDLSAIKNGNTANGDLAYGTTIAATLFYRNLGASLFYWDSVIYPAIIAVTMIITQWSTLFERLEQLRTRDTTAVDLFYSGATIFFFTFILSSNWDYRLIYLLLLLPALSQRETNSVWSRFIQIMILLSASFLLLVKYRYGWMVSGYAKVVIASITGYLVLRLLLEHFVAERRRFFPLPR